MFKYITVLTHWPCVEYCGYVPHLSLIHTYWLYLTEKLFKTERNCVYE